MADSDAGVSDHQPAGHRLPVQQSQLQEHHLNLVDFQDIFCVKNFSFKSTAFALIAYR